MYVGEAVPPEHEEDGRVKGCHRFKVLLIQSQPPYKDKNGHKTWEATLGTSGK